MNNEYVYGKVLEQVPAPELIMSGTILPPKVIVKQVANGERKYKL